MMTPISDRAYAERLLSQVRVANYTMLPRYLAQTADFDVAIDYAGRDLLVGLSGYVLQDHLVHEAEEICVEVPATWWQLLKRDHLPMWFIRRWPVKYATLRNLVTFDRYRTYPDASVDLPRDTFGKPYVFERLSAGGWED